jgi:hypothetical protein
MGPLAERSKLGLISGDNFIFTSGGNITPMWTADSPKQFAGLRRAVRSALPPWALAYVARSQKKLRKTVRKSLPALLPGIHQVSNRTGLDRHPRLFAAGAALAPNARSVLSFGCSTGEECASLRKYFPTAQITGADINPLNICRAWYRYGGDGIAFAYASRLALRWQGGFDAVFCLFALLDTRLKHEASIADAYPFKRFDDSIRLLDSLLKPGGLLVLRGTMYRFCDTSVADRYDVIPMDPPIEKYPTFARDGNNDGFDYRDVLFRKKAAAA